MSKQVVIRLDRPGALKPVAFPFGTVAGDYSYWIETVDGLTVGATQVTPGLVSAPIEVVDAGEYIAFASRLDGAGVELAGSRAAKRFTITPEEVLIDVPFDVVIDIT
jgi:hypothetical protein